MTTDGENIQRRILFVDDESLILSGLRRSLNRVPDGWNMEFMADPAAALSSATEHPRDVLITDLRMPGVDGLQLLRAVQEKQPSTVRFILSANVRRPAIFDALSLAHRVLLKPCGPRLIEEMVCHWLEIRDLLPPGRLRNSILGLGPLPLITRTHDALAALPDVQLVDAEAVLDIAMSDISLAAECYRLAHGILQDSSKRFGSVKDAVSSLGQDGRARLITADKWSSFPDEIAPACLEQIQDHSTLASAAARSRAMKDDPSLAKGAATAALLHDIGKLAFFATYGSDYLTVYQSSDGSLCERESSTFGINHADLGACLLAMWGASPETVNAVKLHHIAPNAETDGLAIRDMVYHANIATHEGNAND